MTTSDPAILQRLRVGDIVLTSSTTLFSRTIRFFERLQTGQARVSHAAIALLPNKVIESLWRVRISDVAKYQAPGNKVTIYRLPLTVEQQATLYNHLLGAAGNSYGLTKLPLFALDGVASWLGRLVGRKEPVFFFTQRVGLLNIPVCSQFVVYALLKWAGIVLTDQHGQPVPWRIVSPDYLDDLLQLPANQATVIYQHGGT